MTLLQITALVAVTVAGTAVVVAGDALRQTLVLGIYGLALTMLFFPASFTAYRNLPLG